MAFSHHSQLPRVRNSRRRRAATRSPLRAAADDYFAGGASKSLAEIDPSLGTGASAALGDYVEATTRTAFLTDEGLVAGASLADVRTDAFVYAYFYGLCVHKLAHFFDVVHGTRHDFFMSEYRANYDLQWSQLLLARGLDPAKVEKEFRHLLWKVVD